MRGELNLRSKDIQEVELRGTAVEDAVQEVRLRRRRGFPRPPAGEKVRHHSRYAARLPISRAGITAWRRRSDRARAFAVSYRPRGAVEGILAASEKVCRRWGSPFPPVEHRVRLAWGRAGSTPSATIEGRPLPPRRKMIKSSPLVTQK